MRAWQLLNGSASRSSVGLAGLAHRGRGALALAALALFVFVGLAAGVASRQQARADDDEELRQRELAKVKKIWMLEVEHGHPKRVRIGREPHIQSYWYFPFTLKNVDAEDHHFFLEVSAESDKGRTYRSLVDPPVLAKVRKLMGKEPFERLWSQEDLTTAHSEQPVPPSFPTEVRLPVIKAGDAVPCVVIFKGPDPEMDTLRIRFRGLTNDVEVEKTDDPHERVLYERVLVLQYQRLGDEFYAQEDPIEYVGRTWERQATPAHTDLD